jgi:hypothetical protein
MKTPTLPSLKTPAIDLDDVRKPAFAVVGAADLAVEQVRDAGAKAGARAASALGTARGTATSAFGTATSAFGSLTTRGEELVATLRGKQTAPPQASEGR